MKEVTINGVVYVPKGQEEKKLRTIITTLPKLSNEGYIKWYAYYDVLKICAYVNNEFESDGEYWIITNELEINSSISTIGKIYHFTSNKAAEYALIHFKEVFKTFYS